jgi:quinol monooxygenase YgiN
VLEAVHYRVDPANCDAFLAAREVHQVRLRAGALVWRLYEDVARPDRWIELWAMESWTDHLREAIRLDETGLAALARAAAMHRGEEPLEVSPYLNVDPEQVVHQQNMRQYERITRMPEQAESDDEQRDCEGRVTPFTKS